MYDEGQEVTLVTVIKSSLMNRKREKGKVLILFEHSNIQTFLTLLIGSNPSARGATRFLCRTNDILTL